MPDNFTGGFIIHSGAERGKTRIDWLESWHSFSFADFYDPKRMGFSSLRVINDDIVAAGKGFAEHGHRDMEIATFVLSGALSHRDSLGNGSTILPGDVQIMSAGTGIRHSEFNGSATNPVHLLQVWILPERTGITPRYDQKHYGDALASGDWVTVLNPGGTDGAIPIHQDVVVKMAHPKAGTTLAVNAAHGRKGWLQLGTGAATLNGHTLVAGDGVAFEGNHTLTVTGDDTVLLWFDLA